MPQYNPESLYDRELLAQRLIIKLHSCGFEEDISAAGERVFYRFVPETTKRVVVYTTIVGNSVRQVGKDAIRVCGLYRNSQEKWLGLIKTTRVNRAGTIEGIVDRTYQRMRETYGNIRIVKTCKCGAPMFIAKSGKSVCSDFCWLKKTKGLN